MEGKIPLRSEMIPRHTASKSMKSLSSQLAAATLALAAAAAENAPETGYDGPPEQLHIYLLIGQSNMSGRAPVTDGQKEIPPRTLLLNAANTWEAATHPFNQYSTIRRGLRMQRLGPGYGFAAAMTAADPSVTIGLIVNARGGSGIGEWQRGEKAYDDAVARARAAMATGRLRGILWHQGERNREDPDGYLERLAELIASLRADLEAPELPFVAGQIHNLPAINDQIARLPETVPFTRFASSDGLSTYDRWHFDTESTVKLGKRYAEAMINLQKEADAR